jgi:hypothetical protein
MAPYVFVNTPGGEILAEVDEGTKTERITLAAMPDVAQSFEKAAEAMKANARRLYELLEELSPDEVEISFGIKAGAEGGTPFFGLAKVSGEASYTVTMKWKAGEESSSTLSKKPLKASQKSPKTLPK